MIGRAITTATVLLGLVCGTAHAAANQESIFQDDDLLIHVSPAEADRTMGELAELGVDRVRLSAIWRDIDRRRGRPT